MSNQVANKDDRVQYSPARTACLLSKNRRSFRSTLFQS